MHNSSQYVLFLFTYQVFNNRVVYLALLLQELEILIESAFFILFF